MVDPETGLLAVPWYRLLIGLWQRLGGNTNAFPSAVYGQQVGQTVNLFNAQTGEPIGPGPISFGVLSPLPEAAQVVGTSPTTLTMTEPGMLVISGGSQTEVRRPPGAFVVASLTGGALWLLAGDQVRLTWFAGPAPTATLFPFTVS